MCTDIHRDAVAQCLDFSHEELDVMGRALVCLIDLLTQELRARAAPQLSARDAQVMLDDIRVAAQLAGRLRFRPAQTKESAE
jgi:hypothetical protein